MLVCFIDAVWFMLVVNSGCLFCSIPVVDTYVFFCLGRFVVLRGIVAVRCTCLGVSSSVSVAVFYVINNVSNKE